MEYKTLQAALSASPDNIPLRLLVAESALDSFEVEDARCHFTEILKNDPSHPEALLGLIRVLSLEGQTSEAILRTEDLTTRFPNFASAWLARARLSLSENQPQEARSFYERAVSTDSDLSDESLLERIIRAGGTGTSEKEPQSSSWKDEDDLADDDGFFEGLDAAIAHELELEFRLKTDIKFINVGGMEEVKNEIRMKVIHPLKNPKLFQTYGKKAGGGLLMYGPPGCGKTLLALATAGEVNANFFSVGLHQILDMYIGESEDRLHKVFELARKYAPSILFFDEIDALATDRRDMRQSAGRGLINQFLAELDGAQSNNDNVLILGATNAPWHLDSAFLRPGRFDRLLFVPPPDAPARAEILKINAKEKPIVGLNPEDLAKRTKGFSGADLKAVFDHATEVALSQAMTKGQIVPINGNMLTKAVKKIRPSTLKWFESAKNYALYANQSGFYDDVLAYLGIKK